MLFSFLSRGPCSADLHTSLRQCGAVGCKPEIWAELYGISRCSAFPGHRESATIPHEICPSTAKVCDLFAWAHSILCIVSPIRLVTGFVLMRSINDWPVSVSANPPCDLAGIWILPSKTRISNSALSSPRILSWSEQPKRRVSAIVLIQGRCHHVSPGLRKGSRKS